MTTAVRYFSRTGNTKKLAEGIACALGLEAKTTDASLEEKVDVLFLGSAVYAAGVDDAVKEFIKNNASKIGKIVNFSTAALLPSTYKQVSKLAEESNVQMAEEEFHCRGAFAVMHKNRPNEADIKAAQDFAKKIISE